MIFMQSREGRRFIGRLDPGDELIASLKEHCVDNSIRCGEIRATGFLRDVVLEVFHHGERRYRPIVLGPVNYQLTSFTGNVSVLDEETTVHIHATLLPDLATGDTTLMGGRLKEATVVALEFTVDSLDDFTLVRQLDEQSGFYQWVELSMDGGKAKPTPLGPTGRPVLPGDSKDKVVRAVETPEVVEEEEEDEDPPDLQKGDVLDHPRLKRCEVVSFDGERAVIRMDNGRTAELHMSVISLHMEEENKDGTRVYSVQVLRRR